ncbi:MAG: hypothetical protein II421_02175 [Bacteroidales bacterium]|nr:hypothetical protein [Bacteroidales bacterium]
MHLGPTPTPIFTCHFASSSSQPSAALSSPSAAGGVPGNGPSFPALLPRAACRAAGAVSLRSTPPFTAVHGPPSYDAEGGTGSGHPATSARRFFCTLVPLPPCARAAPETPACPAHKVHRFAGTP